MFLVLSRMSEYTIRVVASVCTPAGMLCACADNDNDIVMTHFIVRDSCKLARNEIVDADSHAKRGVDF